MKKFLLLALAAFLVVSSTGFALAQEPDPAGEPTPADLANARGFSPGQGVEAQSLRMVEPVHVQHLSSGDMASAGTVVAWEVSRGANPADYATLNGDLVEAGFTVGTIDMTYGIPADVDILVITSFALGAVYPVGNNGCLNVGQYTGPQVNQIWKAVSGGMGLLLLNENGFCGSGTANVATGLGVIPAGNQWSYTFGVGPDYSANDPAALFNDVTSWEVDWATSYVTISSPARAVAWNGAAQPAVVTKQQGAGCAVIVGDSNWFADYPSSASSIPFIDRLDARTLANNAFGFLESCGLWADPGGPYSGQAGTELAFDGTGSVNDRPDPITSYVWDFGDTNTGTGATPPHTYAAAGIYDVCLTVSTGPGRSDTNCTTADIIPSPNLPPVADPGGPYLGPAGTPIDFDGTGSSDPDSDALSYAWDFGDGSATGTGATPSHTYEFAEVYDVCLTVNDGTVDSPEVCTQAAVYDRSEGFVTGAGKIYSPLGAYADAPDAEGAAHFAFVSKYLKGAKEPTGQTSFNFKAGDLKFESTSYEWLVVTGNNYARFKGNGTISGEGDHKFMVWAGDGNPDTFQIKIWGDNGVVYDNGGEDPITSGNIVIHSNVKK